MSAKKQINRGDGTINFEVGTYKTEKFVEDLFAKLPQDISFVSKSKEVLSSKNALNVPSSPSLFIAPGYATSVYKLDKIYLELHVQLIDAQTKTLPLDGKVVGPVNNLVNSMISEVKVTLFNDTVNGRNTGMYPYRSQLAHMINYTNATKHDLADELFIMDTRGHYGPSKANNKGFESRRLKFIDTKNIGLNDTWKQEPISVWTCLNTDFDGLKKSLIPNVPVSIDITWNSAKFYLMQPEEEPKDFFLSVSHAEITLEKLELHSATLSRFENRYLNEHVTYNVDEVIMGNQLIPRSYPFFKSGTINQEGKTPMKIYLVFVEATALYGHKNKNPFDFKRHWELPTGSTVNYLQMRAMPPPYVPTPPSPPTPRPPTPLPRPSPQSAKKRSHSKPSRASRHKGKRSEKRRKGKRSKNKKRKRHDSSSSDDDDSSSDSSESSTSGSSSSSNRSPSPPRETKREKKAAKKLRKAEKAKAAAAEAAAAAKAAAAKAAAAKAAAAKAKAKAMFPPEPASRARGSSEPTSRTQGSSSSRTTSAEHVQNAPLARENFGPSAFPRDANVITTVADINPHAPAPQAAPVSSSAQEVLEEDEDDVDEHGNLRGLINDEAEPDADYDDESARREGGETSSEDAYEDDNENDSLISSGDEKRASKKKVKPAAAMPALTDEQLSQMQKIPVAERPSYLDGLRNLLPFGIGRRRAVPPKPRSCSSQSSSISYEVIDELNPDAPAPETALQAKKTVTPRKTRGRAAAVATTATDAPLELGGSAGLNQTGSGRGTGDTPAGGGTGGDTPAGGKDKPAGGGDDPAAGGGKVDPKPVPNLEDPSLYDAKKKYAFITKVDLVLNNINFNSISKYHTKHDCSEEYKRFKMTNGTYRNNLTEGISYEDYNSNSFIVGFDLATAEQENLNQAVNSVQVKSDVRVDVSFSEPIPHDLIMVTYCQYSNAISIASPGRVLTSYVNTIN